MDEMIGKFLDDVMPEQLEWREWVGRYPRTCLLLAVTAGFVIGQQHGTEVANGAKRYVSRQAREAVDTFLD